MATQPDLSLDVQEQLARIRLAGEEAEKLAAESRKFLSEQLKFVAGTRYMPARIMLATAGLLGAGAAIAKLFFP